MHLFGVNDEEHHNKTVGFWSDVYGFKMSSLRKSVIKDAQIITIEKEAVVTDMFLFKSIDCLTCTTEQISSFDAEFCLRVNKDSLLTGIGSSFETFFNDEQLEVKVEIFFY